MNKYFTNTILLIGIFLALSCNNKSKEAESVGLSSPVIDSLDMEWFPVDCSIRAIEAVNENTLWYAGSKGQYGYTNDAGKSWNIDILKHPDKDNLEFRAIAVTDDAVMLFSVASPALLFRSEDNGKSWNVVYQENDSLAFYDAMAFWDNNTGIAMGDPTNGCLSIIKTIDGGKTWNKIDCEILPETVDGEAAFAASNGNISLYGDHVWIVSGGQKARVFHSNDRGENWEVIDTPIAQGGTMTGIFSVDFYDENNGIIWGGDWEDQSKNIKNKAITSDGGKTWRLLADGTGPGYRSSIRFVKEGTADQLIAVGIPGISTSVDRGETWNDISDLSFYTIRRAGDTFWLAGRNRIAKIKMDQAF
jgi:photosystem II stability/assembly factor-like uncharacterized protein